MPGKIEKAVEMQFIQRGDKEVDKWQYIDGSFLIKIENTID